ncbi:uncharacterized protein LOC119383677 isoform X2 [Rhipicephalus sanguineus]|uniref:uncharacterized protein LOC119383677 isoform X2 n=1 Tax=Rhipicephalus sanguineus TaxID=34632 RepID=UPI0018961A52|nr:uncharacterized protein LOC119383677 isoform X2 [Rhipicephalus sanguineus]
METHAFIILLVVTTISESFPNDSGPQSKGSNPEKPSDAQLTGSNEGQTLPGEEGGHNGAEEALDLVLGDCDQCSCKLILRQANEVENKCTTISDIRCTCNGNHCTSKEISNCLADMSDTSR